jgi:hypothetical protein
MLPAAEAANPIPAPMKFHHSRGASALVQAIDVLCHHAVDEAGMLELRQNAMTRVGLHRGEPRQPELAARPVSGAVRGVCEELRDRHGCSSDSALAAIAGNAGVRADARTRGDRDHAAAERPECAIHVGRACGTVETGIRVPTRT